MLISSEFTSENQRKCIYKLVTNLNKRRGLAKKTKTLKQKTKTQDGRGQCL